MVTPVLAFSGYSNSFKTTTLVEVIKELVEKGYKVAVLKHHHKKESGDISINDGISISNDSYSNLKDTDKFKLAGASFVKLIEGVSDVSNELSYLDKFNYSIILLEGFKGSSYKKLFFLREVGDINHLAFTNIIGIISNINEDGIMGYPVFKNYDVGGIVKFIENLFLKGE